MQLSHNPAQNAPAVSGLPQSGHVRHGGRLALKAKPLALCLAFSSLAFSQQEQTALPPVRPFVLPPRIGILNQAPLSLQQALALALANNRDIDSSRADQEKAHLAILGARGVYDTRFGLNVYGQKAVTPVASTIGGSPTGSLLTRTWYGAPQLLGNTPWFGGSYEVDFVSQRVTTNNTFATLVPQYPTSLNLIYTQPLWRNLRIDSNRHQIEVAKKNQSLTDEQFRLRAMQVMNQAEQAYWELVFAYRNLEVQLEAVRIGIEQDASNRRQQQQGLLAPIDVVAAQRQLSTFETNAYSAHEALTDAENALKLLILADRADPLWSTALIPSTPVEASTPTESLEEAVMQALADRPEMAQVRISSDINKVDTRFYHDQTKPQVDLVLTRTHAGLAGSVVPPQPNPFSSLGAVYEQVNELSALAGLPAIPLASFGSGALPPAFIGGYGQSLSALFAGNFPTTEIQLRISMPIRNRTAEANLASSLVDARKIADQRQQTELSIEAGVRNAMQSVQSAKLRLQSASVARESADQQYESEQRQFRAGTSTLFLVQQRQSDMITARSVERRAESDLGRAIASYELATASILRVHDVALR
ncbi:MAG: TolC family protein [Bryobacterales bacterium]|nr:TolC family protein [Bryobacterales bacterium]MBV9396805.1 TolC family protein [Bryobacterales bacterium]